MNKESPANDRNVAVHFELINSWFDDWIWMIRSIGSLDFFCVNNWKQKEISLSTFG